MRKAAFTAAALTAVFALFMYVFEDGGGGVTPMQTPVLPPLSEGGIRVHFIDLGNADDADENEIDARHTKTDPAAFKSTAAQQRRLPSVLVFFKVKYFSTHKRTDLWLRGWFCV